MRERKDEGVGSGAEGRRVWARCPLPSHPFFGGRGSTHDEHVRDLDDDDDDDHGM